MVKGVATSIITVAVLMGSVVACGGSSSKSYDYYSLVECDVPESDFAYWEARVVVSNKNKVEYRYTNNPVPTESQLIDDDSYSWVDNGARPNRDSWKIDRYSYLGDCVIWPPESAEPTPISNLKLRQCKQDLQAVADNLNTYDDDYYDRLFKNSLRSCVNKSTWNSYAPSSIANQLSAACILYSDYPVCKN